MTEVVILGGGWAGVLYALEHKLRHLNANITILEKQEIIGGLLRSEIVDSYLFDVGGSHVIFSSNKTVLDKMLSFLNDSTFISSRKSFVRLSNQLIPYPIENNLNVLPPKDRVNALISFLEAWTARKDDFAPKNLREWIYVFFGRWIAEKYLVPYNLKIWKRRLEEIDVDWIHIPGRLPIPYWRDIVKSAMNKPTIGYKEQSRFYYPKHGGIQCLFNSVMERAIKEGVNYIKGYKIKSIKRKVDGWLINNELYTKKLVSSIPLNELVKLIEAPEHIIKLSRELDYNRIMIVGLAINKPAPEQHWVYVPTPDTLFHRYAWISNYSPLNAPPNKSTLIAEITIPPNQPINTKKYIEETIHGLEKLEVIKNKDILFTRSWLHEYGYPIHTLVSNRARDEISRWLKEQGVTLIGRWGCWQYWNMDKVYQEVLKLIN